MLLLPAGQKRACVGYTGFSRQHNMPMSNLCIQISGSFPPKTCGIGDYTSHLVRRMRAAGADVEVWTRATTPLGEHGRGLVSHWDAENMRTLGRALCSEKPGVVHLQYEPGVYDRHPAILRLPFLARRAGAGFVTTFHSLDGPAQWGRAHRLALLPLLLGSRDITVCSGRQYHLLTRIPRLRDRVHLIPIGSNIDPLPFVPDAPSAGLRLVYFGFVWRGRNIELLLRALAAVRARDPQASLEIVGGLRDDAYHQELLHLADQLGVGPDVLFSGDLEAPEVSQALRRADIALLPYATGVSTGRGTLMAALAHGLPLVTFSVPDNLSPLFKHGENMMLAPAGDEAQFISHTVALTENAALRAQVAAGAAALAPRFDWMQVARQVLALPTYASARANP